MTFDELILPWQLDGPTEWMYATPRAAASEMATRCFQSSGHVHLPPASTHQQLLMHQKELEKNVKANIH
jgi:hypothetical protein